MDFLKAFLNFLLVCLWFVILGGAAVFVIVLLRHIIYVVILRLPEKNMPWKVEHVNQLIKKFLTMEPGTADWTTYKIACLKQLKSVYEDLISLQVPGTRKSYRKAVALVDWELLSAFQEHMHYDQSAADRENDHQSTADREIVARLMVHGAD